MTPRQAARKLRQDNPSYRHLFNSVADALLIIDPDSGQLIDLNEAALLLYGYSHAEAAELRIQDLSAEPEETSRAIHRLRDGAGKALLSRLHKRRDGSTFQAEILASSFTTNNHKVVMGAVRDVTERSTAQTALAESELKFRQMAESITSVFWMTTPEKDRMVYVSPAYETIWGRSRDELYRDPKSWLECIVPEDRDRISKAAMRQPHEPYDQTYRIRRPDGTTRWIRDRGFVIKDAGGKATLLTGAAEDITQQRLSQEALQESREFLEKAQSVANIGSWVYHIDDGGRVAWSTEACRIFGVDPATPRTGQDFYARVHPDDLARARGIESAALRGGSYDLDFRIVRPDGEVRWARSRASIIRAADGTPLKMFGIIQDITDARLADERLKRTHEQLLQAQKMEAVGRLAGGVAHDFNNILTAILGLSEISIAALPPGHPVRQDLDEIRLASLRAAALTQQLLAFSRRQIIQPRVIALDDTVLALVKMLGRVIGEDVELSVDPSSQAAAITADPGQIEQLIMNLAVNARDAMPEGGRLSIKTDRVTLDAEQAALCDGLPAGDYASLTVADTGTGMSVETLKHLFEPFYTTKSLGKGTGLGLATCYGIVKQNGGAITCRSALGKGTSFRILFPRVADAARDGVLERREGPRPGGHERVLLIEDDASVRELVRRSLTSLGYEVLAAVDGEDGLRLLREDTGQRVRLLLTDMVMPHIGGARLAEEAARLRPDLKVLFSSGYTDDMLGGSSAIAAGAPFLPKPFTASELAGAVRRTLDGPARPLSTQ